MKSLLLPFLVVGLVACGGDDDDDGADAGVDCALVMEGQDTYTPGLEKVGDNGYTVRLMSADPAPPAKGNNTWTIQVLDPGAAAATGMDVFVTPCMPHHQHGTPIGAEVTEQGDPGTYEITPVNLFMPGIWEVTLELGGTGGTSACQPPSTDADDVVVYKFCIDG